MNIEFEHNFQQKYMLQAFKEPVVLKTKKDVLAWRSLWMAELKSWHSPYKAVIDCQNLSIQPENEDIKTALSRMLQFFEGFHLRKAAGYGFSEQAGHKLLPFAVLPAMEEAYAEVGIRTPGARPGASDFRSTIQIQNHFRQHTVEVSFTEPVMVDTKEKSAAIRSKLTNNLMQWHSKWNLLFDCTNLEIDPNQHSEITPMFKYFNGLFLKKVLGYSPKGSKETYPFEVYRARHTAVAKLEAEGAVAGDDANCKSR